MKLRCISIIFSVIAGLILVTACEDSNSPGASGAKVDDSTLSPPKNTVAASIIGVYDENEVLIADPGTWEGNPAPKIRYEWLKNDQPAGDQDRITITPTDVTNKVIFGLRVIGENSKGTASSIANNINFIPTPPRNITPPVIWNENEQYVVSLPLTIKDPGTWLGIPKPKVEFRFYAKIWVDYYKSIKDPIYNSDGEWIKKPETSYVLSYFDVPTDPWFAGQNPGYQGDGSVYARVTATNASGTIRVKSNSTPAIKDRTPVYVKTPFAFAGILAVGQTISVNGEYDAVPVKPTTEFIWKLDNQTFDPDSTKPNTSTSYTFDLADKGKTLSVSIRGYVTGDSEKTTVITAPHSVYELPSIANTMAIAPDTNTIPPSSHDVGGTFRVNTQGVWKGYPTPKIARSWWRVGDDKVPEVIPNQTGLTYVATNDDVGYFLLMRETATNDTIPVVGEARSAFKIEGKPLNRIKPAVTGSKLPGFTLSTDQGTWQLYPDTNAVYETKWVIDTPRLIRGDYSDGQNNGYGNSSSLIYSGYENQYLYAPASAWQPLRPSGLPNIPFQRDSQPGRGSSGWAANTKTDFYLGQKFTTPVIVTEIRLAPLIASFLPNNWKVEGKIKSADTGWVHLYSSGGNLEDRVTTIDLSSNTQAFQEIRFYSYGNSGLSAPVGAGIGLSLFYIQGNTFASDSTSLVLTSSHVGRSFKSLVAVTNPKGTGVAYSLPYGPIQ